MGEVIQFSKLNSKIVYKEVSNTIEKSANDNRVNNNRLYVLIGIPCSGKSTYANKLASKKSNTVVISTDEIRKELTGTYEFTSSSNKAVFDIAKKMISQVLELGFKVVFDATNTNKQHRKSIISIAKKANCKTVAIVFKTPIDLCLKRNSKRNFERRVPEDVILSMSVFKGIDKTEGFDEVINIRC